MLLLINNISYAYHDKTHKPTKGIAIVPMDVNGNGKLDEEEKFYGTLDELMETIAKGKYLHRLPEEEFLRAHAKIFPWAGKNKSGS